MPCTGTSNGGPRLHAETPFFSSGGDGDDDVEIAAWLADMSDRRDDDADGGFDIKPPRRT